MFCLRKYLRILHIPLLLFIILINSTAQGEFRFCHKGPQKFKNSDCPYGIFFPKPVSSSCIYYANDQTGPTGEAEIQACGTSPKPVSSAGERVDKYPFQALFMDVTDPNDKGELGNLGDDCESECFGEWKDLDARSADDSPDPPSIPPPAEEPEYDDMVAPLLDKEAAYHSNLTAQLFQKLLNEDKVPQLAFMRSAMLLQKSFSILRTICEPFISSDFTDQLYKGFLYLVLKSEEKVVDIGMLEKNEIDEALQRCLAKEPQVTMHGHVCEGFSVITGYSYKDEGGQKVEKPYVIQPKSFRWNKYDPFVEGAWAALDFVHGYCFPYHEPNLNYHHIYEAGLEPLFTKTIMQRWPNPPVLKRGDSYWNNLLDAKDAKIMMQNLDACVQAGYSKSVYQERLNRPFNKFHQTIGDPAGGTPAGSKTTRSGGNKAGYTGTVDQYWDWYTTNDAFNKYLKDTKGTCIKTETELNNLRVKLEQVCNP